MNKLISIVALASALALAAGCKKKNENADNQPKVTDPAGTAAATGTTPGTAAATGAAPATGTEPGTAAATGAAPATTGTGVAECDEYLKTFDDMTTKCKDKLGAAYEGLKTGRDTQAQSFESWKAMDDATRQAAVGAAASGCKAGTDSLKTTAKSVGCEL